jgi:hypothetical protein
MLVVHSELDIVLNIKRYSSVPLLGRTKSCLHPTGGT